MSAIEVKGVSRSFRSVVKKEGLKGSLKLLLKPEFQTIEAVKNVSFQIEEGAFIGLIGANGAGKTTLLKMLSGLIPPSQGELTVLGFKPFERNIEFKKSISLVMGQKAQLWWDLPAIDAFELIQAIYEIPRQQYKERVEELTELLDVKKLLSTQIRRLSLGERMKMELIGALIHWPKVIFLDEPTIGLDVIAAQKLREFLRVFNQKQNATIILTSHNMDDIERLCSRVMIIQAGQMIYDGRPQGLMREGERSLKVRLKGLNGNANELPTPTILSGLTQISEKSIALVEAESEEDASEIPSFQFSIKQDQIVAVLQLLMQKFQIIDMGIEEQSLESVIQRLFSGNRS